MPSAWVKHVQSVYAKGKSKGMTYSQAMQKAKVSWAKKKKTGGKAASGKKVAAVAEETAKAARRHAEKKKSKRSPIQ